MSPPPPEQNERKDAGDRQERDARLVREALSEKEASKTDALEAIYRNYLKLVYKVCWNMTGNMEDAEELTQDTFFRAFEKLGSLKDPACLKSWLCQIARRSCIDRLRQRIVLCLDMESLPPGAVSDRSETRQLGKIDLQKVLSVLKVCIKRLDTSLIELLRRRLSGYSPALLAKLHGDDAEELKRRNDILRYRLESCMASKGFPGFRLKDYFAYVSG